MNSAIAIGRDAKAWGHQSVSIGGSAKATGKYALSFGNSAEASAMDSFAFGNYASAKGLGAIAIGSDYESSSGGAQAYSGDTIAIGRRAMAGNEMIRQRHIIPSLSDGKPERTAKTRSHWAELPMWVMSGKNN